MSFLITAYFSRFRLHREALKQSAMDPKTGMIDINILTTGLSITDRKRRLDASKALLELMKGKGRVPTLNYHKLYEEFREQTDAVGFSVIILYAVGEKTLFKNFKFDYFMNLLNVTQFIRPTF